MFTGLPIRRYMSFLPAGVILAYLISIAVNTMVSQIWWRPSAYDESKVAYNLTKSKITWSLYELNSQLCKAIHCPDESDLTPISIDVRPLTQVGSNNLKALTTYKLEAKFRLPEHIKNIKKPLGFHYLTFFADESEFYLNGEMIHHANRISGRNIALPEFAKSRDELTLTIKFRSDQQGDPGFNVLGNLLVGDIESLNRASTSSAINDKETILTLTLPRLLIALFFTLGMIFSAYPRDYLFFVTFLLFSAIRLPILYGDTNYIFGTSNVDRVLLLHVLDILTQSSFILFICSYFRYGPIRRRKIITRLVGVISLVLASAIVYFAYTSQARLNYHVIFGWRVVALTFSLYITLKAFFILLENRRNYSRLVLSGVTSLLLFLTIPASIWNELSGHHSILSNFGLEFFFGLTFACNVVAYTGFIFNERDRLRQKLGLHVDEMVVDELMNAEQPITRWIDRCTVLFIDIIDFSVMCERLQADEVMSLLQIYLEVILSETHQRKGFVNKFMGDAVMVLWGLNSEDGVATADNAIATVVAINERVKEINRARQASGEIILELSFGLHTGSVVAGHIGNDTRAEFSIIGSTVNIAARVEKLTRNLGCHILMSEATLNAASRREYLIDFGEHALKGISTPIRVYGIPSDPSLAKSS